MSLVVIKPSKLSAFAFSFDIASCPAGISAVAGLTQQHIQYHPNLRHCQGRGIFFSAVGQCDGVYPSSVCALFSVCLFFGSAGTGKVVLGLCA